MKTLVLVLNIILFASHATCETAGHFEASDINEAQGKMFVDGLLERTGVILFPVDEPPVPEGLISEVWKPAKPEIETFVSTILRFKEMSSPMSKNRELQTFDIELKISPDSATIRHSLAKDPKLEGGVIVRFSDVPKIVTIEGYNRTDVRAATSVIAEGYETPGVLLCLVGFTDPINEGSDAASSDAGTRYTLSEVKYSAYASSTGEFQSGLKPGKGRAEILTTSEIPNAERHVDTAEGRKPYVSVKGRMNSSFLHFPDSHTSTGGVLAILDFQNGAGFRRIVTQRDVVRVQMSEVEPMNLEALGLLYPPSEGVSAVSRGCFVVVREYVRSTSYSAAPSEGGTSESDLSESNLSESNRAH